MDAAMLEHISRATGFIAALDQSGGSTPGALAGYGLPAGSYSGDDEMFALIHAMRVRIITSPVFSNDKVIGAILFERTMDGEVRGVATPTYLWEGKGIVPFLKVDKGLLPEADGVSLMKPISGLADLLGRARDRGIFGTKMRSTVARASASGIKAIVDQQFALADEIAGFGLMPILEPEVLIASAEKAEAEAILLERLLAHLDDRSRTRQVMIKLTIPERAGFYQPLIAHKSVTRVVALSGGFTRADACRRLVENPGMIASFSRALLGDLKVNMNSAEFDQVFGAAINEIYRASTSRA